MRVAAPPVTVIAGPPGVGKTQQVLNRLRLRRALVLVGRHDLADEAGKLLPNALLLRPKIRVVNGRIDPVKTACLMPEEILKFREEGRGSEEAQICGRCSVRPRCPYYGQFEEVWRSWIAVHDYAVLPVTLNAPEVVVIDESILAKVVDRTEIDIAQLNRFRTFFQSRGFGGPDQLVAMIVQMLGCLATIAGPNIVQPLMGFVPNFWDAINLALSMPVQKEWGDFRSTLPHPGPDNFSRLFEAIAAQATAWLRPGRLWIEEGRLLIYERLQLNLPSVPLILLDSGADEVLIRHLFPDRPVQFRGFRAGSETRIVQVKDGRYGKTSLRNNLRARSSIFRQVRNLMEATLRRDSDHHFGLITFKEFVPELERILAGIPVEFGHYWAERGTNRFADAKVRTLFVVGTPTPNPQDMFRRAAGFFFPDQMIFGGVQTGGVRYGMHADMDFEVLLPEPKDPRLAAFLRQGREFELMQAVGRIRPFSEGASKLVVVFSPVPIPHFPPTELVSRSELNRIFRATSRPTRSDAAGRLAAALARLGPGATNAQLGAEIGVSKRQIQRLRKVAEG